MTFAALCRSLRGARSGVRHTLAVELGAGLAGSRILRRVEASLSSHTGLARPWARARSKLPDGCDGLQGTSRWRGAFRYPASRSGWGPNRLAQKLTPAARH